MTTSKVLTPTHKDVVDDSMILSKFVLRIYAVWNEWPKTAASFRNGGGCPMSMVRCGKKVSHKQQDNRSSSYLFWVDRFCSLRPSCCSPAPWLSLWHHKYNLELVLNVHKSSRDKCISDAPPVESYHVLRPYFWCHIRHQKYACRIITTSTQIKSW